MLNEATEMYPAVHNKDGSLAHSSSCQMAFGRKDKRCPRCVEMLNGAPSRDGWQKKYYAIKKRDEERDRASITAHFNSHKHLSGGCGPVCTFGEW